MFGPFLEVESSTLGGALTVSSIFGPGSTAISGPHVRACEAMIMAF
jgi:hypothetical protein